MINNKSFRAVRLLEGSYAKLRGYLSFDMVRVRHE